MFIHLTVMIALTFFRVLNKIHMVAPAKSHGKGLIRLLLSTMLYCHSIAPSWEVNISFMVMCYLKTFCLPQLYIGLSLVGSLLILFILLYCVEVTVNELGVIDFHESIFLTYLLYLFDVAKALVS